MTRVDHVSLSNTKCDVERAAGFYAFGVSPDEALALAWSLAIEDTSDEVLDALEPLIPILVDAGYANADEHAWGFTPAGVRRADELGLE